MIRIHGRGIDFVASDRLASLLGFLGLGRRVRCVGFYTGRLVVADSAAEAVELAKCQVTEELLTKKIVSTDRLNVLQLTVDDVAMATTKQKAWPNRGFTFYEREL